MTYKDGLSISPIYVAKAMRMNTLAFSSREEEFLLVHLLRTWHLGGVSILYMFSFMLPSCWDQGYFPTLCMAVSGWENAPRFQSSPLCKEVLFN